MRTCSSAFSLVIYGKLEGFLREGQKIVLTRYLTNRLK